MNIKGVFKSMIPLIIGILIGAGFTKNPNVKWIILGYVIFMFIFALIRDKVVKVKQATDKKTAIKEQAWETVQNVGEATLKGNKIGANMFDKWYREIAFYLGIALFLSIIVLIVYKLWIWVLVNVLGLIFFTVLNQCQRNTREIKEFLEYKFKDEAEKLWESQNN